jgi:hypothetical protein
VGKIKHKLPSRRGTKQGKKIKTRLWQRGNENFYLPGSSPHSLSASSALTGGGGGGMRRRRGGAGTLLAAVELPRRLVDAVMATVGIEKVKKLKIQY